jgi:hypothetical protein
MMLLSLQQMGRETQDLLALSLHQRNVAFYETDKLLWRDDEDSYFQWIR